MLEILSPLCARSESLFLHRRMPPPTDHRDVEIAGGILLIAIGSSMVIDAVEDIFR